MKRLFDDISFEVEHEFYLARVEQYYTGRDYVIKTKQAKKLETDGLLIKEIILHPETEYYKTYPIQAVVIRFLPKYAIAPVAEVPLISEMVGPTLLRSAYTPLFEHLFKVGEHHDLNKLTAITSRAMKLASKISDPVKGGIRLGKK